MRARACSHTHTHTHTHTPLPIYTPRRRYRPSCATFASPQFFPPPPPPMPTAVVAVVAVVAVAVAVAVAAVVVVVVREEGLSGPTMTPVQARDQNKTKQNKTLGFMLSC